MEGALDGLNGIIEIAVDLGRDAFTLTYDPDRLRRADVEEAIRALGFTSRFLTATADSGAEPPPHGTEGAAAGPSGPLPDPIRAAVEAAGRAGSFVLIDFTAEWCAPCRVIEKSVLPDERVQQALENYVFVRVDTDTNTPAVEHFRVQAMPTLLILDGEGAEITRLVGPVPAATLAAELIRASTSGGHE